jgi:UDP-N-acetylglucosamine acyltransferase
LIHKTAEIDPSAELAEGVEVGPWTIIGPDVSIGPGTVIGPHVVIRGPTKIGANNRIFQFSSIGEECQDKKYKGEPTLLEIGDDNVIRESCTIHRGTVQDNGITRIGNNNLLMVNVHVAHDVMMGDHSIVANNASLAGHVHVGDYAVLGGYSAVHQFCHIGAHSICGAGSVVLKDVAAYTVVNGNTASAHGINVEGMRRRGFSKEATTALHRAYRIVFRKGLTVQDAIKEVKALAYQCPELEVFIQSILASTRGIVR